MHQLKFNEPHIQERLRVSWAIQTCEDISIVVHKCALCASNWENIYSVFPILQRMIDSPVEKDIDQLNYIIWEIDNWISASGNLYPQITQRVLEMIQQAESALGCTSILTTLVDPLNIQ